MNIELNKLSTKEHFDLIKKINERYEHIVIIGLIINRQIFDLSGSYFPIGLGGFNDELVNECLSNIDFNLKDGYYEINMVLQYQEKQTGEYGRVEIPSYYEFFEDFEVVSFTSIEDFEKQKIESENETDSLW